MNSQQILFVCATPDDKETFEANSTLYKSLISHPNETIDYHVHYSNSQGLSQLYNTYLTPEAVEQSPYEIIVFVHDDVSIEDAFITSKLIAAHKHYDIVGLAGGKYKQGNTTVPMWHLMCAEKHGAVAHPTEKDGSLTVASFGSTPAACDLIDGLFISVNTRKLVEANVKFNEDMTFHFYDLALCMNAKKASLKIGVWPIWVVHEGLGDSFNTPEWRACSVKFLKQYFYTSV